MRGARWVGVIGSADFDVFGPEPLTQAAQAQGGSSLAALAWLSALSETRYEIGLVLVFVRSREGVLVLSLLLS